MGDTPGNRRGSTGTATSWDRRNLAGSDFYRAGALWELRVVAALVTSGRRGPVSPLLGMRPSPLISAF